MLCMPYQFTLGQRTIELLECDPQGHYYVFWEDLPVGFVYRLDLGIDVGTIVWAGSSPFLNRHAQEIGMYIQKHNL